MDKQKFKEFLKYFTVCAIILIAIIFVAVNYKVVLSAISKLFRVLRPFIIGIGIAFVLNKPASVIQKFYIKLYNKKQAKNKQTSLKQKSFNGLSIATVYFLFFAIISGIFTFIIPGFVSSISTLGNNLEIYYNNLINFINEIEGKLQYSWLKDSDIFEYFQSNGILKELYSTLYKLTKNIPDFLDKTFIATKEIISVLCDIFIGFIFSAYLISGKKKIENQLSRTCRAIFPEKKYNKVKELYYLVTNSFSLFINGQLTEAFILGILCSLGMIFINPQYTVLISVIIGLTNLIPIFGPIFGTIVCGFLLLLINPMEAVIFVIFIIILQQIDGNLIYPRVVGNVVGLAPIWTLFAIIIGGGLFGILGMILAVPTMSVTYTLVRNFVNKRNAVKINTKL